MCGASVSLCGMLSTCMDLPGFVIDVYIEGWTLIPEECFGF